MPAENHHKASSEHPPEDGAIDYFSSGSRLRGLATKAALRARTEMYELFADQVPFDKTTKVVDVGVTPDTALADSNFFEQFYPHTSQITATSIEDATNLEQEFPGLTFVQNAPGPLPFADDEFDVVFCSAVIEHVGDTDNQQHFVDELLRVGNTVFLTTPNRWFPIELHTFLPLVHWLPQRWHQRVLRAVGKDFWASTDNLNLLTARELTAMFDRPGVTVDLHRRRLLSITSNLVIVARREITDRG